MNSERTQKRRFQHCIRSNVDWQATSENIWNDRELEPPTETDRGLLKIKFKTRGVTALVSPQGTIQMTYPADLGLEAALEVLKPKLVPLKGKKLILKPERKIPLYDEVWDLYQLSKRKVEELTHAIMESAPYIGIVKEHPELFIDREPAS